MFAVSELTPVSQWARAGNFLNIVEKSHNNLLSTDVFWYLTDVFFCCKRMKNGKYSSQNIELLEEKPDYILYRYEEQPSTQRQLVLFPLSSMLQGQQASPSLTTSVSLDQDRE